MAMIDAEAWRADCAWYRDHGGDVWNEMVEVRFCRRMQLWLGSPARLHAVFLETARRAILVTIEHEEEDRCCRR